MSEILKPCPFCGDPMEIDGTIIRHRSSNRKCAIGYQAWDESFVETWNNRSFEADVSANDAEIARLRWAAEHGLAYAECWVDEHGGIDGCDMNDRIGLEKIRAALQPTSGGEADV